MKKLVDKAKKKYIFYCDECGERLIENKYEIYKSTKKSKQKINDICKKCYEKKRNKRRLCRNKIRK